MIALKIWLALMCLKPAWDDSEDIFDRGIRMAVIAGAIDDAAKLTEFPGAKNELRAALFAVGRYESRYARNVHEGRCAPRQCDQGRATGVFQVWPLWFDGKDPKRGVGTQTQPTLISTMAAARALADGKRQCGTLLGMMSVYATGNTCRWRGAKERERLARRLERWL